MADPIVLVAGRRTGYLPDVLDYQLVIDLDTNKLRLQYAAAGSQVWVDVFTVDNAGNMHVVAPI